MFSLWHWFMYVVLWFISINPDRVFTIFSKWVVVGWMAVHTVHWARVEYVRLAVSTERKIAKIRQPVDLSKESAEEEE